MRVAFATGAHLPEGVQDDYEAAELLNAEFVVWSDPEVDWSVYDRVVLRSAWDYTHHINEFLAWCRRVGPQRLRNRPELVAFNADKRYLANLAAPTVPTIFVGPGDSVSNLTQHGELVVKPNVSAGARNTGRFPADRHDEALALIGHIQSLGRTALLQPYLESVDHEGETSLVYLGGSLSHVLRKRPVLRTHGIAPLASGHAQPAAVMFEEDLVTAGTADETQLATADRIHAEIAARFGTPLYARIDLVRDPEGEPLLLELELIEPSLYLDIAPGAAERLASAVSNPRI
jgi:hypothetical protein